MSLRLLQKAFFMELLVKSTWKSFLWYPVVNFRMKKRRNLSNWSVWTFDFISLKHAWIWIGFMEKVRRRKNRQRAIEKKIGNKMMINFYIISVEMNMLLNNSFWPLWKRLIYIAPCLLIDPFNAILKKSLLCFTFKCSVNIWLPHLPRIFFL